MRNLQVVIEELQEQNPIKITLEGSLTSMSAINFKNDILRLLDTHGTDCHIDISSLQSMDATGVNALIMVHCEASRSGNNLYIYSDTEGGADEFLHLAKMKSILNLRRA